MMEEKKEERGRGRSESSVQRSLDDEEVRAEGRDDKRQR
jgi:hypothetical protein